MPDPSTVDEATPATSATLSRARLRVLWLVCTLSMITYLDRVCFGAAAPQIASELGLAGVADLKWAFTAFSVAYAVFELPSGWLGDRLGPRSTLIRIVLWWSACTALTGLVGFQYAGWTFGGLGVLVLLRFLFGAGEAGAYPNIARAIYNWFPQNQWETAQGYVWMSGRLMGGASPFLWALLVTGTGVTTPIVNWRGAFLIFGLLGVVWCVLFRFAFSDRPPLSDAAPAEAPATHAHGPVPWKWLLTNRELIVLCLAYSLLNYGWAFNITYLPGYLQERFPDAASPTMMAVYAGAPLWVGAIGCLAGGYCVSLIDRWVQNRRRSRQLLGAMAMVGSAVCWLAASQTSNLHVFCIGVALAAFCVDLTLGSAWASCQDIGRDHTAVAAAMMNTIGTLGSAAAGWLTGTLVQQAVAQRALAEDIAVSALPEAIRHDAALEGFQFVFLTYSAVYIVAALSWWMLTRLDRMAPPSTEPAA